jgi:Nif-specific regulatory protein
MKTRADRIKNLTDNFSVLLEKERQACQAMVSSIQGSIKMLQGDTADRRLQQPASQLKRLQERLNLLAEMAEKNFLAKINREAEELNGALIESRTASLLAPLFKIQQPSSKTFCSLLLDGLIEITKAERGFILFYVPESTEADIIAARNYKTQNLSLKEYDFSRSLLREIFQCGEHLLIEDASSDPKFSMEMSIRRLEIRSVLAMPLKQNGRTVGALYLENNRRPSAFNKEELALLERMAEFTIFYLNNTCLLPFAETDNRVFFDSDKASKEIIGSDPKIQALLNVVEQIADGPATVLIKGESGTGKELVARALHYQSRRRNNPFVQINCAAIPENLLESELFGHEKGAFTGATERYIGQIEQGNEGTIFLDEISELAYPLQAKLLRFLQSHEFHRLGGKQAIKVDVRVVAATSKDLKTMMEMGKFQEALYYRLSVIPLEISALRERKEDIPLLADHFIKKFSAIYKKDLRVEHEVYECLKEYPFPGNVRELENLIHRLVALATKDFIYIGDLPREILQARSQRINLSKDPLYRILHTPPADIKDLQQRKEEIKRVINEQERQLAERVVQESDGNLTLAASRLGIHRVTLHNMTRGIKKINHKDTKSTKRD